MHTVFNRLKAFLAELKTSWRAQPDTFCHRAKPIFLIIECFPFSSWSLYLYV